jgi:hypothetical protein
MSALKSGSFLALIAAALIASSTAGSTESASPEPQESSLNGSATCPLGTQRMLVAELFMGRDIESGGEVSDADWEAYVAETLSRDFPDGFTVLDARGAFRDAKSGLTNHEDTKLVEIAAPDNPATLAALTRTMRDYKSRFRQQTVGLLLQDSCGAF